MARITNFPEYKTSNYAELWSPDPMIISSWYGPPLPSEDKGDVWGIGARYKIDITIQCFVTWDGTLQNGTRTLRLVEAGNLADPPWPAFLPIYPGVNLIEYPFSAPEPEPPPGDEPQPEPDEPTRPTPPMPPTETPRAFLVYGGGIGNQTSPVMTWWGDTVVFSVPRDWFEEAWEAGPKKLIERLGDGPETDA